jgi:hypothetical protein
VHTIRNLALAAIVIASLSSTCPYRLCAQGRYATSDNQSGYVHWIDLYDANNNRIDPQAEFPQPYSPERTCGRCHEFDTIAHGWHFNAVDPQAEQGRPGQPWIWSDPRSGTHLPLSYRGWEGTYNPDVLGLSRWEVAAKLGGFLPGGGPGSESAMADSLNSSSGSQTDAATIQRDRSAITGALPVDCLLCHRNIGNGYSPFVWTEQIQDQNFAFAPTVALGLAEVTGSMARLKDFDPKAADAASKLPKLNYDLERFRADGKVFFDVVRKPHNDACYYCHTNVPADSLSGTRWLHDEDVHLRAGLACADCHRNGLDHQTVRGFEGEQHPAGTMIASLSCQGCHLGDDSASGDWLARGGRLGAPKPAHAGLPPVHFEKMSCTACHSGPLPQQQAARQINSIAHHLGEHVKRTGDEFPAIVGPVNLPLALAAPSEKRAQAETDESSPETDLSTDQPAIVDASHTPTAKYTPQRLLWSSFWGTLEQGQVTPLNPEVAHELVRRPLKVRRDFTQELGDVSLSLTQRKAILGDDRARIKEEERTPQEQQKIREAESAARQEQINERLLGALTAIEAEFPGKQAVFVTGGTGWVRYGQDKLKILSAEELGSAAEPYAWPMAHNVRPARQSLGAQGCTECHSDTSTFFFADVQPVGLVPNQVLEPIKVHNLQQADIARLQRWNALFGGRSVFKVASLIALSLTCLIALSVMAWSIGTFWQRRGQR